jgi:Transposase DDE domain
MTAQRRATKRDVRLERSAERMLDQILATRSLVVRSFGQDRNGEMAAHRLLGSPKLDVEALLSPHVARAAAAVRGRRVVAAQDTTEINFAGREARRQGLGPAGNGEARGFFIHPVVAVDAQSEAVLGIAGARIWTRDETPTPQHQGRPFEDKESLRWLEGAEMAAEHLGPAATQVIMVADREGDIYPLFARRPRDLDFVVRANHDRALADGGTLFSAPEGWSELGRMSVRVAPRGPGDKGRTATVALKAGRVTIRRPKSSGHAEDPVSLTLGLIEAREVDGAAGVGKPLLWRLVTTLPTATLADAEDAVRLYRLRWRIEEVFRTLKSDGLKLEDSQVTQADRLFKLAALGLVAATRILQLVDARDGGERPATDVVAPEEIAAAAAIGARLEGRTERQKNPHAKGSLAWLAWIAARLGGWNCYYKPPGPKTMARGLDRLLDRIEGFKIAHGLHPALDEQDA